MFICHPVSANNFYDRSVPDKRQQDRASHISLQVLFESPPRGWDFLTAPFVENTAQTQMCFHLRSLYNDFSLTELLTIDGA